MDMFRGVFMPGVNRGNLTVRVGQGCSFIDAGREFGPGVGNIEFIEVFVCGEL
jgi:hypothetical protein